MSRTRSRPKQCAYCGRAVNNSFICRRCGRELRELLVGDGNSKPVVAPEHNGSQPGAVWYLQRLRETAYRQARMERALGARTSNNGYALLADGRAVSLIAKISVTAAKWNADLDRLVKRRSAENDVDRLVYRPTGLEGLDEARIKRLASNIPVLRHNCPDIDRLLHNMLDYAKEAWAIINRPDDICCGPCRNMLRDKQTGEESECGVMLYAEEYETDDGRRTVSDTVQCPRCRKRHDVKSLRESLIQQTRETLFSGPELLALMEKRLNDRIPKTTFYQLIRDGRLCERGYRNDEGVMIPLYTYADVCDARIKPKPKSNTLKTGTYQPR